MSMWRVAINIGGALCCQPLEIRNLKHEETKVEKTTSKTHNHLACECSTSYIWLLARVGAARAWYSAEV